MRETLKRKRTDWVLVFGWTSFSLCMMAMVLLAVAGSARS